MKNIWIGLLIIGLNACGFVKKMDKSSEVYANYSEDLSSTRISFPNIKTLESKDSKTPESNNLDTDNQGLESALANLTRKNTEDKFYSGYTVLVYSGVDRDMAFKTRNTLYSIFPEVKIDMQYQQPRYLIKAGKYVNRVEALANFYKLKESFPSSRIIQDRFMKENTSSSEERVNVDR
jgi:hypothetical protein